MKVIFDHSHGHVVGNRVFCEAFVIPEGESEDFLLENGWNPNMEDKFHWYQSRSCRINLLSHKFSNRRNNLLDKFDTRVYQYYNQKEIDDFYKKFYTKKKYDIFHLYKNSSSFFDLKVMEIIFRGKSVGFARFLENENSNLFIDHAYEDDFSELSELNSLFPKRLLKQLGINIFHLLSNYTKEQNKNYLYLFETYTGIYNFKSKISGAEIWQGEKWLPCDI